MRGQYSQFVKFCAGDMLIILAPFCSTEDLKMPCELKSVARVGNGLEGKQDDLIQPSYIVPSRRSTGWHALYAAHAAN